MLSNLAPRRRNTRFSTGRKATRNEGVVLRDGGAALERAPRPPRNPESLRLRAAGEKAGMSDEVDIPLSCSVKNQPPTHPAVPPASLDVRCFCGGCDGCLLGAADAELLGGDHLRDLELVAVLLDALGPVARRGRQGGHRAALPELRERLGKPRRDVSTVNRRGGCEGGRLAALPASAGAWPPAPATARGRARPGRGRRG